MTRDAVLLGSPVEPVKQGEAVSEPSDLERFIGYARVFEVAQAVDAWNLLEPYYTEAAVHVVHDAGSMGDDARGRAAVISAVSQSVLDHDRRFDVRIPEILEGPLARPDGIWMRYGLTLRREGLPELRLSGVHLTTYTDGLISRIEEWMAPGTAQRVEAYFAEHASALRPAGSAAATPSAHDLRDLEEATARSMVRAYGSAKSQQDVGAALSTCSEDFVLETPAFGTRGVGRQEVAAQLAVFFSAFPDYNVELEGFAHGDALVAWGRARISFRGEFIGIAATQKTADLEVMCLFDIEQGSLRRERFIFDRAGFCEQLGISAADLATARALVRGMAAGSGE